MPIEIKELIIRTEVVDSPRSNTESSIDLEAMKKELLEACDRKIKTLLKQQKER
ncbi:MAG: DUF5908 family protein [Salibacteraceae bacterium]